MPRSSTAIRDGGPGVDALDLARLQFAMTTNLHFLFVALTLGLAPLVAIMQTRHVLTGAAIHERMTRFWGQIYLINYGVGILTGLVMEFQFGLNWSGLSHYAGAVFGAPLALETMVAFFLESTLLGLWIFGWHRIPPKVHLALIWLVTLTAYLSAFWIMVANSFLQNPVGVEERDGQLVLTDFGALIGNRHLAWSLPHVVGAALVTAAFVMIAISSYHLFRRTSASEFFTRSLRTAVVTALIGTILTVVSGHLSVFPAERTQPGKFDAPAIDGPFYTMLGIGDALMLFSILVMLPLLRRDRLARWRWLHPLLIALIPLPYAASVLGWVSREVGRQPWLIYGKLRVADALTPGITADMILASLIGFAVVLGILVVLDYVLIAGAARRGPDDVALGTPPPTPGAPPDMDAPARSLIGEQG
ncbi:cytochrome ubiquinol oxidase subunit I [Micromonospora sp. NPDC050200]|uniref:cytochrome ubiquinol oxidase subunit I n=1 Tax=Micromonospora sp. NPDC050200 TaxID=3155664 RepID=UPI0033C540F6